MSDAPTFELLRFEAVAVTATAAIVELDGVWPRGEAPARPRMLVESGGARTEFPAVGAGGAPWSASFAVPLGALSDQSASFDLVSPRGPLIALPAPTLPDDDRYVRLARSANALRRRAAEATSAAEQADARLALVLHERDRAASERDELRDALTSAQARAEAASAEASALRDAAERAAREGREASERAVALARREADAAAKSARADAEAAAAEARAEAEVEIAAARGEAEAARREADEAHDAAQAERERREAMDARLIAAEDEVRHARRELRDARARLEALSREERHRGPRRAGESLPTGDPTAPTEALGAAEEAAPHTDDFADRVDEPLHTDDFAAADHRADRLDDPADADAQPAEAGSAAPQATAEHDESGLWFTSAEPPEGEESVRVIRRGPSKPPATAAARTERTTRPARHRPKPEGDDEVLEPAAVGARLIERASTSTPPLGTWPRFIAVGLLALLFLLLVLIVLGVF